MNRALVIATIALVAVVMIMSVAVPAMAEHNDTSQDPGNKGGKDKNNPCEALEKVNEGKAKGKDRAKANNDC